MILFSEDTISKINGQKVSTRRLFTPEGQYQETTYARRLLFPFEPKKNIHLHLFPKRKKPLVEIKFSRTSVKVPQISTQFLPSTSKICYDHWHKAHCGHHLGQTTYPSTATSNTIVIPSSLRLKWFKSLYPWNMSKCLNLVCSPFISSEL